MTYVYAKLSRRGLCNKLFPWARAVVYADKIGARLIAPKWVNILRIGPWIRHERDKRYYFNEFTNEGYASRWFGLRPSIVGAKIISGMDGYFDLILNKQELVKAELRRIANPRFVRAADEIGKDEFIGVHVRRGDFVAGGFYIADSWYVKAIAKARELVGCLPVKIFCDGLPEKLVGITSQVQNSIVMPAAPAIQDLLSLAHAKALVGTSRSTFSMWAVYLGQMPSLWSDVDIPPKMYADRDKSIILQDI